MRSEHWALEYFQQLNKKSLVRTLPNTNLNTSVLADFTSNDYLTLNSHSCILEAACNISSFGSCAARLVHPDLNVHSEFEQSFAKWRNFESSLLFGAGYLANLGVISSIVSRHGVVFSDKFSHASLIDGIILSQAKHFRFRHNDINHLRQQLLNAQKIRSIKQKFLIVTESVFSMDGDCAPLGELSALAKEFDAMFLIDEAHALGVFGSCGSGLINELGLSNDVSFSTATLSKSFASYGGIVCCSDIMKNYFINSSSAFIFNTALPEACIRAAAAALAIMQSNPDMGVSLLKKAKMFRDKLRSEGFNVINSSSQIVPLVIGDNDKALELSRRLNDSGIRVAAMRSPSVPKGTARLRFSINLSHSEDMLKQTFECIKTESKILGII